VSAPPIVERLGDTASAYLQLPGGWFLNNAGWVVGHDRTVLIDTCATESRSRRLLELARAANRHSAPLTAVLTHAHGDHANGAGLVDRDGGEVIASEAAAAEVATGPHTYPAFFSCSTWGCIEPPSGFRTITSQLALDLGGTVVDVVPAPEPAHTAGDLVVWLPETGVLFTGDLLFHGVTPLALHGSLTGWLRVLDWLTGFKAARMVPGHGPIIDDSRALVATRDYFEWLLHVAEARNPNFTTLERQACDRWPTWLEPERHAVNLRVAHAEVHTDDLDVESSIAAMLQSAGGPIALEI
jgi:cyclase